MSLTNNVFCILDAKFDVFGGNFINELLDGSQQISIKKINESESFAFANFINQSDFPIFIGKLDGTDESLFTVLNAFCSLLTKKQIQNKYQFLKTYKVWGSYAEHIIQKLLHTKKILLTVLENYLFAIDYAEKNNLNATDIKLCCTIKIENLSIHPENRDYEGATIVTLSINNATELYKNGFICLKKEF